MPYAPQHKEETRARIVECARRMFNRYGFEAVSIDQIMASAGLTRGGFYHHFANKEELYSEAIAGYLRCNPVEVHFAACAREIVLQMVNAYLSRQHLEDVDRHCPMIALPSDVARAGPVVRRTYEMLLGGMVGVFERGVDPADGDARQTALAIAALCVGGMVLARTIEDSALATEIREAARDLALEIGGLGAKVSASGSSN
jgi:TetR/AcrR family transcriptional regulator, transcriptional repressor for nem operon